MTVIKLGWVWRRGHGIGGPHFAVYLSSDQAAVEGSFFCSGCFLLWFSAMNHLVTEDETTELMNDFGVVSPVRNATCVIYVISLNYFFVALS